MIIVYLAGSTEGKPLGHLLGDPGYVSVNLRIFYETGFTVRDSDRY
jgi:hypothetical protein